jgi:hypothetical protein
MGSFLNVFAIVSSENFGVWYIDWEIMKLYLKTREFAVHAAKLPVWFVMTSLDFTAQNTESRI